jgi:hypothetical protein
MASEEKVLLTVILHHDQSKTLEQIMEHAKKTGFYRDFPPEGTELISWTVAMQFGFILHLSVDPSKLRNLNRFLEQKAWGAFRCEVYPSYDFKNILPQVKKDHA